MFNTVDNFRLLRAGGRLGDETAAGSNVEEDNRIVVGMDICFHDKKQGLRFRRKRETDFAKIMYFVKSSIVKGLDFSIMRRMSQSPEASFAYHPRNNADPQEAEECRLQASPPMPLGEA